MTPGASNLIMGVAILLTISTIVVASTGAAFLSAILALFAGLLYGNWLTAWAVSRRLLKDPDLAARVTAHLDDAK